MGDVTGGIGEDHVVDIRVFEWGVGILEETVEEKDDSKSDSAGENLRRGEIRGGHDGFFEWCAMIGSSGVHTDTTQHVTTHFQSMK